jgi:hypothetical protein
MKDIHAMLKAQETYSSELMGQIFGEHINSQDVTRIVQGLLPESFKELQNLCRFFEKEMAICREAGAYFSSCLAGAAMIESFLLSICLLEETAVRHSKSFQTFKKKNKPYKDTIVCWTLKELIPIAEEIQWVNPAVVNQDLVKVLIDSYYQIIPTAEPGVSEEDLKVMMKSLGNRPDVALLCLMQSMRNLVHGGRCIRLEKKLASKDFSDWAILVIALTAEIRDCLVVRLNAVYHRYFSELLSSPVEFIKFTKLLVQSSKIKQISESSISSRR